MWTSDLSDCWLNTPDVMTADDDDNDVGGPCAATVAHQVYNLLDHLNVPADPSVQSFHHRDVTFQPSTINDPLSPPTHIPLPVLQFYDTEAPLEEQLVTPPVLAKTIQPDLSTSAGYISVADLTFDPPDNGSVSSSTVSNLPLSEPRQERFVLIQLPLNSSDDLISILSRVTNNNEFVVENNNSSTEIHHHHHYQQQQQEPTSENNQISTSTAAAEPCSGYQLQLPASGGETGSDVTRLSEEDVVRMLDDATSIVVC